MIEKGSSELEANGAKRENSSSVVSNGGGSELQAGAHGTSNTEDAPLQEIQEFTIEVQKVLQNNANSFQKNSRDVSIHVNLGHDQGAQGNEFLNRWQSCSSTLQIRSERFPNDEKCFKNKSPAEHGLLPR